MLLSSLLEGQYFYSKSRQVEGIVQEANLRTDISLPDSVLAYAVRVRPSIHPYPIQAEKDFWSTLYVGIDE